MECTLPEYLIYLWKMILLLTVPLAFLPGLPLVAILSQNRLAEQYDTIPNIVVIPDMLGFAL